MTRFFPESWENALIVSICLSALSSTGNMGTDNAHFTWATSDRSVREVETTSHARTLTSVSQNLCVVQAFCNTHKLQNPDQKRYPHFPSPPVQHWSSCAITSQTPWHAQKQACDPSAKFIQMSPRRDLGLVWESGWVQGRAKCFLEGKIPRAFHEISEAVRMPWRMQTEEKPSYDSRTADLTCVCVELLWARPCFPHTLPASSPVFSPPLTTLLQIRPHIWQRLLTDLEQRRHLHDSFTWFLAISDSISWLNLTIVCLLKPPHPCTQKCVVCVHLDVWPSLCRGCFHIHTLGKFPCAHFESEFKTCRYVFVQAGQLGAKWGVEICRVRCTYTDDGQETVCVQKLTFKMIYICVFTNSWLFNEFRFILMR